MPWTKKQAIAIMLNSKKGSKTNEEAKHYIKHPASKAEVKKYNKNKKK